MSDIAGIPYIEAEFDKNGASNQSLAAGRHDRPLRHVARLEQQTRRRPTLYHTFFENFVAVAQPNDLPRSETRHRRRDLAFEEVR